VHWLSVVIASSLAIPLVVPLLRRRNACLWTVVWNFGVFVAMMVAGYIEDGLYGQVVVDLGFATASAANPLEWHRYLTAMYIHADPMHVLMNMVILTLIGVPFEDRIGTRRWLALYLVTGMIGSLVDAGFAAASGSGHIGIGASGAIFGVMGAFAALYPRDEIPMVLGFIFLQRVPVFAAVIVMALLETLYVLAATKDNVGHLVHVSSLVAGVALALPLGRSKRDREREAPDAGRGLDLEALRGLATSEELRMLYEKIAREDVLEVRQAWLERFAQEARCPECGAALALSPGRLSCTRCGFRRALLK
jgi:membrane associated rhomboid family serine protease/ribosomal protein S27AE